MVRKQVSFWKPLSALLFSAAAPLHSTPCCLRLFFFFAFISFFQFQIPSLPYDFLPHLSPLQIPSHMFKAFEVKPLKVEK